MEISLGDLLLSRDMIGMPNEIIVLGMVIAIETIHPNSPFVSDSFERTKYYRIEWYNCSFKHLTLCGIEAVRIFRKDFLFYAKQNGL